MSWSGQSRIAKAISLIPSPTRIASATRRAPRASSPGAAGSGSTGVGGIGAVCMMGG